MTIADLAAKVANKEIDRSTICPATLRILERYEVLKKLIKLARESTSLSTEAVN